jgi:hypothetical protein
MDERMVATEDGFRSQKTQEINWLNHYSSPIDCIAYEKVLYSTVTSVWICNRFVAGRTGGLQTGRPAATTNVWTRLLRRDRRGRKHLPEPGRRQNFYGQ